MSQKSANVPHAEALARLVEGNKRFTADVRSVASFTSKAQRQALVTGQQPFAIVLSCSDSRAPSELIFDCGLGELFVVRVAGNVVASSILGSVEFAAATFGTQLIVVMGHSRCGAVAATVEAIRTSGPALSESIGDIVARIRPAVTELVHAHDDSDDLLGPAIRANVRVATGHLRRGSRLLEERILANQLRVVGAEYSFETGLVDFFDV